MDPVVFSKWKSAKLPPKALLGRCMSLNGPIYSFAGREDSLGSGRWAAEPWADPNQHFQSNPTKNQTLPYFWPRFPPQFWTLFGVFYLSFINKIDCGNAQIVNLPFNVIALFMSSSSEIKSWMTFAITVSVLSLRNQTRARLKWLWDGRYAGQQCNWIRGDL